jgi:iron(III) transport system ATP-binding protein
MGTLEIQGITKRFGKALALDRISLNIAEGELFFLLGPSGCGKTTLLRIIAGLQKPDEGGLRFKGRDLLSVPVEKRNIGMVFQQFSLWPHMTVFENVAYGLKLRKISGVEIEVQVMNALRMVGLQGLEGRKPGTLSGGEQQRAALARAMVCQTDIILLDEPLSNLDAKLRKEMRVEIKRIHRRLRMTMVYVTHDQEEASAMADRMALLKAGRIVQVGTPQEIYERPANPFVADFFGHANIVEGNVKEMRDQRLIVQCLGVSIEAVSEEKGRSWQKGDKVLLVMRPQDIRFADQDGQPNTFIGKVLSYEFHGAYGQYQMECIGEIPKLISVMSPELTQRKGWGEGVRMIVSPEKVRAFSV